MLRGLTKTGVAAGMHLVGIDKMIGAHKGMNELPLVLSYHRVVKDFQAASSYSIAPMLVSTDTFERHLDWIGQHYDFVSLDELEKVLEGKPAGEKPVAAVTFDDGYRDVYLNAFPILKRKGIPSAVFVVTDLLDTNRLQAHDEVYLLLAEALRLRSSSTRKMQTLLGQLAVKPAVAKKLKSNARDPFKMTRVMIESLQRHEIDEVIGQLRDKVDMDDTQLEEFRPLTWDMVREMDQNDVTIGSHTKSHKLLAKESWESCLEEIKGSREILERKLGHSNRHFAYPDGCFDDTAVKAVAAAGYPCAYTTCLHRDPELPKLTIPRRVLWENSSINSFGQFSPAILSCQINGIFDPASKCQRQHWASRV